MGRYSRQKPQRLAGKLLQIRLALNLSQTQLLDRLGLKDELFYTAISGNELGTREPTLVEVLRYARLANVYADVLLDDELDLPEEIPGRKKLEGLSQTSKAGRK